MISRSRFDLIKANWGTYSSWAVWNSRGSATAVKAGMGDLDVLDPDKKPELLASLSPDVVLVGLNAATRPLSSDEAWVNFHDPRPVANDFKIRHALEGTPYWGAYMTDVFIGLHETDSGKVKTWMRANPDEVQEHLRRFESELSDLGSADPLLVAFGGMVFDVLQEHLGSNYRVVKVTHYAHQISKENYRNEMLEVLDTAQEGGSV